VGQLGEGIILDGKEDEWSDLKFRAPMWSASVEPR
jgi:hypothetical protein